MKCVLGELIGNEKSPDQHQELNKPPHSKAASGWVEELFPAFPDDKETESFPLLSGQPDLIYFEGFTQWKRPHTHDWV